MTYVQAERAFGEAASIDPECGIAHWGQAMTYVHPLWPDVISEEKLEAGKALLDKATTASKIDEREQAYVAALRTYYDEDPSGGEKARLASYLEGWKKVSSDHPGDPEAKLFHALALMATAPAADKSYEKQKAAGAMAEEVRSEIPGHPGAHHYIIHAYDSPPLAAQALETARSYGDVAPENSHALHMTSHIFTRLGLWPESIAFNIRAAEAARERTAQGMVSLHHLHALDYLAYAYLQKAEDAAAREVLEAVTVLEAPFQNHAATAYTFAAVPARLALERRDWEAAAEVQMRWPEGVSWDQYPHLVAIPVFARALGTARTGETEAARKAIAELERLREEAGALDMAYDWETQVAVQKGAAEAWLAYASGDVDRGLELMREAAELESTTEKNPVTPGEVLPARELYGDMLLEAGRHADALEQYKAAMERSPNRFNSLFGAGRAAEQLGDRETAVSFYRDLLEICTDPSGEEERLEHARRFVG
jgi:tetratricopeptide (TPR) repeat protein